MVAATLPNQSLSHWPRKVVIVGYPQGQGQAQGACDNNGDDDDDDDDDKVDADADADVDDDDHDDHDDDDDLVAFPSLLDTGRLVGRAYCHPCHMTTQSLIAKSRRPKIIDAVLGKHCQRSICSMRVLTSPGQPSNIGHGRHWPF